MKTSILDSIRNMDLELTIWVNPRGIFLDVYPSGSDETPLVDAKKFATMDAVEFFIRENLGDWKESAYYANQKSSA